MSKNALPSQPHNNRMMPNQQEKPATQDSADFMPAEAAAKRRPLRVVPTQQPDASGAVVTDNAVNAVHEGGAVRARASYDTRQQATPPPRSGRSSRALGQQTTTEQTQQRQPARRLQPANPSRTNPSGTSPSGTSPSRSNPSRTNSSRTNPSPAYPSPAYGRSSRAQIAHLDTKASENMGNTTRTRKNSRKSTFFQGDKNNQGSHQVITAKNQQQARARAKNRNDNAQSKNPSRNNRLEHSAKQKRQRVNVQEAQRSRQLQRQARASYREQQHLSPEQAAQKVYKRRHGRRREGFLLLLLLLTMLGIVLWVTLNASLRYLEIQEVSLPNMVGQPIEQVEAELKRLGLQLERYEEETRAVAPHHVSSQSPVAGSRVRQGRRVVLGVNTPEQAVTLLPLVGLEQEEALAILDDLHLLVAQIDYVAHEDIPSGIVLASEPESSSVLATGSTVHLTVSRGPEAAKITMPQLVGLSVAEAERRVRALGVLQVDKVLAGIGSSKVVQHLPVAGELVLAKAPVTLYYQTSNSNLVWIPDLTGKSMPQVYSDLGAAGLTINERWVQYIHDTSAADGVVTQSPSAGWALRNSPVTLVVNRTAASYVNAVQPTAPVFTGSPTGVGPVNNFVPFDPNRPLSAIFAETSTAPNSSLQRPNIDSSAGVASNIPLLGDGNMNAPATLPPATLPPATLPSATLPSTNFTPAPSLTPQVPSVPASVPVRPSQPVVLAPLNTLNNTGNTPNILQPLPPSRLPIPDSSGNLINPLPPSPNPLIPTQTPAPTPAPTPSPSISLPPPPSTSVNTSVSNVSPTGVAGVLRTIPVNFNPAVYGFLQGRSFRYRLVAKDTQGERTLIDHYIQNGESVSQLVTVYGTTGQVELRIYIDDEYFHAWNP